MNILVVASTKFELERMNGIDRIHNHSIHYASHGIGLLSCTFHLTKLCNTHPDLIIQIGLAGSYKSEFQIGQTVFVHSETLGDEGAENHEQILSTFELNLRGWNDFPFTDGKLINPYTSFFPKNIQHVSGLTVNMTSGNANTIKKRKEKFNTEIETMEGASLHYVCLHHSIPFVQLRTISNVVEPRNKENWDIPLALENNASQVISYIKQLPTNEA